MAISLTSAIPSSVKNAEYAAKAGYADNAGALSGLPIAPEGAPAGSSLRNTIPRIGGDGVTELGQYLDLHNLSSAHDFDVRLTVDGDGDLKIYDTQNGRATITANLNGGIKDYNDSSRTIQIGYAGSGLNTSNLNYIAGYTNNGQQIKEVSKDTLKSWLGVPGFSLSGSTLRISL